MHASRKDITRSPVPGKDRKEERKGRAKAFKYRAISVVSSGTVQQIVGKQAKAKEAKGSHKEQDG